MWQSDCHLAPVVAQACPAGANTAFRVWSFFKQLRWHPPDLPALPDDWGVTWYELAVCFTAYTGVALPVWIYSSEDRLPTPYAFDSPEIQIQKDAAKSLWNQANTLRAVVRYLDNTLPEPIVPKYKKTGASSLVRLGFHKSLIGGIVSRPAMPCVDKVLQILRDYASLPAQTYPHHVRLQLPPIPCDAPLNAPFTEIPFKQRSGLYQRIKNAFEMANRLKRCRSTTERPM